MGPEGSIMLQGDMDVPKMALQRIADVNCIGSCCVKQQIDNTRRLMNAMRYRQSSLRNFLRRITHALAGSGPDSPH